MQQTRLKEVQVLHLKGVFRILESELGGPKGAGAPSMIAREGPLGRV